MRKTKQKNKNKNKNKKRVFLAHSHTVFNLKYGVNPIHCTLKGCGMGPWLVLISPCFRENVVATYKIGPFLCNLGNLLQKNVIVLFFGNQISKWRSFEKMDIFDLLFIFSSHQEKITKIPSAHNYLRHIHTRILLTLLTFFLPDQFRKKYEFIRYGFSLVWVLVLILFRAILE